MHDETIPIRAVKLAVVSPYARSLINFRGPLIRDLAQHQCQVYTLAPDFTPDIRSQIKTMGAIPVSYPLQRTGTNPFQDIRSVYCLWRLLRRIRPKIVLTYQPKANIYGMVAANAANVPKRYALIEGLGFAFTSGNNPKSRFIRTVLRPLYKICLSKATEVFFLNPDDLADFRHMGLVSANQGIVIGGIGVDLEEWSPAPPYLNPFTFTLVARLLREKGVLEFIEAAQRIKSRHSGVRFLLIGPLDTNPGAISKEKVQGWVQEGFLEWVPWTDDVRSYLRRTSVYVLPSYYREGVPRSTQEAMALGRPVITTDAPGCRETVVQGVNGFLVPPRDPVSLAEAMERFIRKPELIPQMGKESRRLAEERFDVRKINARLIAHLLA